MNWNEIQRMLRDTEDARRVLENSRYAREAFDRLDSNTLRVLKEQQKYGVGSVVEEIVKRQLLRSHDHDHAISEYFKNRSLIGEMSINQSRLLESQLRINDIVNSASSGISSHDVLQKISRTHHPEIETALRAHRDLSETYVRSIQRWEKLGERLNQPGVSDLLAQQAAFSAVTWGASINEIVERIVALNGLNAPSYVAARMLEPAFAYGHFASATVELLQQARTIEETNALSGSLVLADQQIIKITAVQDAFIDEVEQGEDEPASPVFYNRFDTQQRELLFRRREVPAGAAYPLLITLSPSAELFEQCSRCFILIEYCNAASREHGGDDIFNPATSWLTITSGLLGNIACDRQTFKEFVLNLYNLLYESVSPRKYLLNQGLVTEAENRVIDVLKNFRNKWLIHESTQGSNATIEENRKVVAADLRWLGAPRWPVTADEYARLQSRLLQEVEAFLALLFDRVARPAQDEN
ncbi:MAG TPA: hypothetical protein VMZ30_05390 [Pyrinomonadaceae bacterium]|nr:hypothetical protein [Pyrinomonadaceae bacterium]